MSLFWLFNNDEDSRQYIDLPSPSEDEEIDDSNLSYSCEADALGSLIGEVKEGPCTKSRCNGTMKLRGEIYYCDKCGKVMDQEDYILWMTDFDL